MILYKLLSISLAFVMAAAVLVGCHDGGTISTDTGSGGGEDIEIGEDTMFSSAAPSAFGRGVTITFNSPIPDASVSEKADEVTLTREQFEAMLVILGPAGVILRPTRYVWAGDGSSVTIWGPFRYCKEYDFVLGAENVSASMDGNPFDFNFSDYCAAEFPFADAVSKTFNILMDGEVLNLGQVAMSTLVVDPPWQYANPDLQTKGLYSMAGASPADGAAYTSGKTDDSQFYAWYEFGGSTDPDASIDIVAEPMIYYRNPIGVGDIDGDGIVDIGIEVREDIAAETAVSHLSIIFSVEEIGLNASFDGLADVIIDAGDPEVLGLYTYVVGPHSIGDIDGDGHADVVFKKEGKVSLNLLTPSEFLIYSGARIMQGDVSEQAWRIINDDVLGAFLTTTGGDVNCDGISDIIASGARSVWNDSTDEFEFKHQKVFIFFGRADFPEFSPSSEASAVLTTQEDFPGQFEVVGLGDINSDGCDDFFLGVRTADGGKPAGGIVAGRSVWPETWDVTEAALVGFLPGVGYEGIGYMRTGLSRTGDLDNDGYDDFALECRSATNTYYAIFEGGDLSGEMECGDASTVIDLNN